MHTFLLLVAMVNLNIKAPFKLSFYSPAALTKLRVNLLRQKLLRSEVVLTHAIKCKYTNWEMEIHAE